MAFYSNRLELCMTKLVMAVCDVSVLCMCVGCVGVSDYLLELCMMRNYALPTSVKLLADS